MEGLAGMGAGKERRFLLGQAVRFVQAAGDGGQGLDGLGGGAVEHLGLRIAQVKDDVGMLVHHAHIAHVGEIQQIAAIFADQRHEGLHEEDLL